MAKIANYDVRLNIYSTKNGYSVTFRFGESLDELICPDNSWRVKLMRVGNRLYFMTQPGEVCVRGDGSSAISYHKLQYSKEEQVQLCKPFEGEYSLKFDSEKDVYYIDLADRNTFSFIGKSANIPHQGNKRVVVKRPIGKKESVEVVQPKVSATLDKKKDIMNLLDILDVDEMDVFARAIIRMIKEKVQEV